LFHAHGLAVAKERFSNDDSVHGTATVIDSADLRLALVLAAVGKFDCYSDTFTKLLFTLLLTKNN